MARSCLRSRTGIITLLSRPWNADVVITNRPNDYHPDHWYTSILVQDSAYMVKLWEYGRQPSMQELRKMFRL